MTKVAENEVLYFAKVGHAIKIARSILGFNIFFFIINIIMNKHDKHIVVG